MKEKFQTPMLVGDDISICIGGCWPETQYVLQTFLMASLQDSCHMEVNYEEGQVIIFTDKSSDEDVGLYDLFPPMMFCTAATQVSRRFLCSGDKGFRRCINADHPYTVWLSLIHICLLYPEDIPTLQEYIGYCLIPSNKGQRMMILKGNGGEGKSQVGAVLGHLFGVNMKDGSIGKVSENRFARADLEHILDVYKRQIKSSI